LGPNGAGKSLVGSALLDPQTFVTAGGHDVLRVGRVSFEAHQALLRQGGNVYEAVNKLRTHAAKFLVVRLGLYPLLFRKVASISTGEIRKVLLARELAAKPELLVLDNAYDGLDVLSRAVLAKLISQTIQGFGQVLVQGVDARATAHTQVLLVTHREEELVPEISKVSLLSSTALVTGGTELIRRHFAEATDDGAPTIEDVQGLWRRAGNANAPGALVVEAENLTLLGHEKTLLDGVTWAVRSGEHWLVTGGNGAGKSTLTSFIGGLRREDQAVSRGELRLGGAVGFVSTELHLRHAETDVLVGDLFVGADADARVETLKWFGLEDATASRRLRDLSQGQQKLALVAAALARAPAVLVLDEVCQGLDAFHRRRVLETLDIIGRHTPATIVYITHHADEMLPCLTHVLEITAGAPTFSGTKADYDAR